MIENMRNMAKQVITSVHRHLVNIDTEENSNSETHRNDIFHILDDYSMLLFGVDSDQLVLDENTEKATKK